MAPKTNWIKIVMIGFVLCFYFLIALLEGVVSDWQPLPSVWAIVFLVVNTILSLFVLRICTKIWQT